MKFSPAAGFSALVCMAIVSSAFPAQASVADRRLVGEYRYESGGESLYDVDIDFAAWRE